MTSNHFFVDETKQRGYLLVAGVLVPSDHADVRRELRGLILPGQRGLHMKDERDSRRKAIIDVIVRSEVEATVYDAARRFSNEPERRAECFRELVNDVAAHPGQSLLVIDKDESLVQRDRECLIEFSRKAGCKDRMSYEHAKSAQEQLLVVPDAIAWCWAKGGSWRERIRPVVTSVKQIA
ncbi:hypothetical protein HNO80_17520 [Arthrobacter sp. C9C5]|nr:hypothetical protein [Arthrobacter sp. C9C5]